MYLLKSDISWLITYWFCHLINVIVFNKMVILKPRLKEFLMKCIEQFTLYLWILVQFHKMEMYLMKIMKRVKIMINFQRILVEIYENIHKHILQVLNRNTFKDNILKTHDKIVYHKKTFNFFPRYLLTHLKITLLVDKRLTDVVKIFFLMKFCFNFMRKNEWKKITSWELFYCTWNHSLLYA